MRSLSLRRSLTTAQWGALLVLALLLLSYVFVRNAWVVDDAFITFRTVDNVVHGHGLRWNICERVQVYTHPLWMMLVTALYVFTSEAFVTPIVLSLALCLAAVLLFHLRLRRERPWAAPLLVLLLISSKSIMDYSSSGLENPLSYFLAVVFLLVYAPPSRERGAQTTERELLLPFLLASLSYVNRPDTVLLFIPALLDCLVRGRRLGLRLLRPLLTGMSPALLWTAFSFFYYGTPLPNTAYAKALGTSVPLAARVERGLEYFFVDLGWEGLSYLLLFLALVLAIRKRHLPGLLCLAGSLLYILYVFLVGAAATHMGGRFFSVPLFFALVVLARLMDFRRLAAAVAILTVAVCTSNPVSPTKMGTSRYEKLKHDPNAIDTSWHVHKEGMALLDFDPNRQRAPNEWLQDGRLAGRNPARLHVGGANGGEAIGYFGFTAGPRKIIVDYVGLADPLLARLPPVFGTLEKSGHFYRLLPRGYLESLAEGRNLIADPHLHVYFDKIMRITRGRLWSARRLRTAFKLSFGAYDHLLRAYFDSSEYRQAVAHCRSLRDRNWAPFVRECLGVSSRHQF